MALRAVVPYLAFVLATVVQHATAQDAALTQVKLQLGMWLRGLYLQLKTHAIFYKYQWSQEEAKTLPVVHQMLLDNLHANMQVNSRMVRPVCSFSKAG